MTTDRSFMLVLDTKSPLDELYPVLALHLDTLRQRGHLSHWDGTEFVCGAVTVVVTGESMPSMDCANHSYSDVFWISKGDITKEDVINGHLTPMCV